ncbi:jerky protein homolog-like [Chelonus insularis]|uniref:jerky protein homolog-like n=1 Tax=Chelonus insularis TaxID=460826 RepID=UPI00158C2813|nr:jerky protein homolog-like [Chelonus insularis]
MRTAKNTSIDNAVWLWFKEKRAAGVALTGPILQEKARMYNKQLGASDNFCASNGWLRSFKERHGLKCKKICGEQLSANQEAVPRFKEELLDFIRSENLSHHQIFNCDETGLNYRALLKSTLCEKSELHPSGVKGRTERITVMACSNVSGTCKLPLVVIGKWARPRHLRNIEIPVSYKSQKSAWMTSDLFVSWYEMEFVPYVKAFLQASNLPPKALLLMDNCSSHNKVTNKDGILVKFFPPNTTSLIQPMDQGCLQNLKLLYKENLMRHIIQCIDNKLSLSDAIKQVNLRNAIFWVADAWKRMNLSTIQKSWNQVWPLEDRPQICNTSSQPRMELLLVQFLRLLQNTLVFKQINMSQLKAWLNHPYLMTTDECLTDSEILQVTREENHLEEDNNDTNIAESGEEYLSNWKKFTNDFRKNEENRYIIDQERNNNEDINNNFHSTLSKKEADLCFNHLFSFCKDNNYPEKVITALNDVKKEIDKCHSPIHGRKSSN